MARRQPAFLVCEVKVEKPRPWDADQSDREIRQWYTLDDEADVADLAATMERPGFGTDYRSVRYEVHRIVTTEPVAAAEVTPLTVKDHALRFGHDRRVDVKLRGYGYDPKGVFWDSRGNSFAVVMPPPTHAHVTSDQGVMLVSINGIGEVRWTVFASQAGWPENAEAVKHFGLTWSS